jgi:hypothetical protein
MPQDEKNILKLFSNQVLRQALPHQPQKLSIRVDMEIAEDKHVF